MSPPILSPMSSETLDQSAPLLPEAQMHLYRPKEPATATITRNDLCTKGRKAAGYIRHIEFDVSGTDLAGNCLPGQAIGVIPPGTDDKGRPYHPRLYSLASPQRGEDGEGKILSTTVKRTVDEHWDSGNLFLGVASNYLCDRRPGDTIHISGPNGKRFLLPQDTTQHDYLFFATGTGIAPFRGMVRDVLHNAPDSKITLVMGAPYETDLLYDDELSALSDASDNFTYLTALSRQPNEDGAKAYVQDRLTSHREQLAPLLESDRTLVYICGIAGMELGIFRGMYETLKDEALAQYLALDDEARENPAGWTRKMLHRSIKASKRVMLEVYA